MAENVLSTADTTPKVETAHAEKVRANMPTWGTALVYLLLLLGTVIVLYPFFYMVMNSFADVYEEVADLFAGQPALAERAQANLARLNSE